jgi:hypothetical protein
MGPAESEIERLGARRVFAQEAAQVRGRSVGGGESEARDRRGSSELARRARARGKGGACRMGGNVPTFAQGQWSRECAADLLPAGAAFQFWVVCRGLRSGYP